MESRVRVALTCGDLRTTVWAARPTGPNFMSSEGRLDLLQVLQQFGILQPQEQGELDRVLQESNGSRKIPQRLKVGFDVWLVAMSQLAAVIVQRFPDGLRRRIPEWSGMIKLSAEKPS